MYEYCGYDNKYLPFGRMTSTHYLVCETEEEFIVVVSLRRVISCLDIIGLETVNVQCWLAVIYT